jgi:hypothetical protein
MPGIERGAFRFARAGAVGFSLLFGILAVWTFWIMATKPKAVDFLAYWAAAKLVLSNHVPSVYNVAAHHAVEMLVAPIGGFLPFPYPPPYLFVVAPFGIPSFPVAFILWVTISITIYAAVVGRNGALPYALSHPSVLTNILIGQNGFLTTSIFAGGMRVLPTRPYAGGAILGLLIIKPQLALLLPFAMVAGREWKAMAGGTVSALLLLMVAFLTFGASAYQGFFNMLAVLTDYMARSRWPWNEMSTVFAALRFFGVPQIVALMGHGTAAAVATALVYRAWSLRLEERVPILAAATMLIPPYLLTYDALLLVVPIIWLVQNRRHLALVPLVWLLCFLPIATHFNAWPGPNTIPLASVICLWALHTPSKRPVGTYRPVGLSESA